MTKGTDAYEIWRDGETPCPHCQKRMVEFGNGYFCSTNGCPNYRNIEMEVAFNEQEKYQDENGKKE